MAARRKYQWEEWFGRRRTILVRGVDYHCSQASMVQSIRNGASTRGVRVSVADEGDSIVIEVTSEIQHTKTAPAISE